MPKNTHITNLSPGAEGQYWRSYDFPSGGGGTEGLGFL